MDPQQHQWTLEIKVVQRPSPTVTSTKRPFTPPDAVRIATDTDSARNLTVAFAVQSAITASRQGRR
ncbi:hypothetical protein [Streptomyces anulatus]|uniref:hypothetical protein n=1 Tax=Streptomyces anulatus TaxID=1892 RepID=UPI002F90990B